MYPYLIRYRVESTGRTEEYALAASCVQHCRDWVRHLNGCTFLSATRID
jgi:hypothetical protein